MLIDDFKLERYFAIHEFSAQYLMSSSDCDGFAMAYVLQQATAAELDWWNGLRLGYTESSGAPRLRSAIAAHYPGFAADSVVVSSPGELNFITMNLLLQPGDGVVVVHPCYQSLVEVARAIGCDIAYWQPNPLNWHFSVDDLEKLVNQRTKLLVLNFPHNPTGTYPRPDEWRRVLEIASRQGIYVLSDEMYRGLLRPGVEELPPACTLYERAISLWGMSKSFGLAGLRLGWLVSADANFLRRVVGFKDYLSMCTAAPAEVLGTIALNHSQAFVQPNNQKIERNIQHFQRFTSKTQLFADFVTPPAGSTAFVRLNHNAVATSLEFSNRLVAQTGIMTVPAEMFGYPGKYLRVGFGRENFPEVINRLHSYLIDTEQFT